MRTGELGGPHQNGARTVATQFVPGKNRATIKTKTLRNCVRSVFPKQSKHCIVFLQQSKPNHFN